MKMNRVQQLPIFKSKRLVTPKPIHIPIKAKDKVRIEIPEEMLINGALNPHYDGLTGSVIFVQDSDAEILLDETKEKIEIPTFCLISATSCPNFKLETK